MTPAVDVQQNYILASPAWTLHITTGIHTTTAGKSIPPSRVVKPYTSPFLKVWQGDAAPYPARRESTISRRAALTLGKKPPTKPMTSEKIMVERTLAGVR